MHRYALTWTVCVQDAASRPDGREQRPAAWICRAQGTRRCMLGRCIPTYGRVCIARHSYDHAGLSLTGADVILCAFQAETCESTAGGSLKLRAQYPHKRAPYNLNSPLTRSFDVFATVCVSQSSPNRVQDVSMVHARAK